MLYAGCCCCQWSVLDDFNRVDDTDPGSEWVAVSGVWAVASSALIIPEDGLVYWDGRNPRNTGLPAGTATMSTNVLVNGDLDDIGKFRVLLGYDPDTGNFAAWEYNGATGRGAIVEKISGIETSHDVGWCYAPGTGAQNFEATLRRESGVAWLVVHNNPGQGPFYDPTTSETRIPVSSQIRQLTTDPGGDYMGFEVIGGDRSAYAADEGPAIIYAAFPYKQYYRSNFLPGSERERDIVDISDVIAYESSWPFLCQDLLSSCHGQIVPDASSGANYAIFPTVPFAAGAGTYWDTDANDHVIWQQPHHRGLPHSQWYAWWTHLAGTYKVRCVADYVDDDNFHFAEWNQTTLRLYCRTGGTDTLISGPHAATGFTSGDEIRLMITCCGDDEIRAVLTQNTSTTIADTGIVSTTYNGGSYCGVRVYDAFDAPMDPATTVVSSMKFRLNPIHDPAWPDDEGLTCPSC